MGTITSETLQKENERLKVALSELTVLNDIATTISSIQPIEDIVEQVIVKCIQHLKVQEANLSLLEDHGGDLPEFMTMIRRQDSDSTRLPIHLDNQITGWMLKHRSIILSNDIKNDPTYSSVINKDLQFDSILCVPLMARERLIGYLAVFDKKSGEGFTENDKRLLSIIGSQSSQLLENARLYEEEKLLMTLNQEINMARDIQMNLLPKVMPETDHFEFHAHNVPAKMVGGDYFDFINLDSGHIGFCVADITGKGMPAAILMSNVQATIRSQSKIFENCAQCLKGTNWQLFHSTQSSKFATLFFGALDPETGIVHYSNGGHDAPLLVRDNNHIETLDATGLLLGVVEDVEYERKSVEMKPGDLLILYSDGITEAMNSEEEEYGLDRLIKFAKENRPLSAEAFAETLLQELLVHTGNAPQSDDITLMVIKRKS